MVKLAQLELTFFMLFGSGLTPNQAAAHAAGRIGWRSSKAGKEFTVASDAVYLASKSSLLLSANHTDQARNSSTLKS